MHGVIILATVLFAQAPPSPKAQPPVVKVPTAEVRAEYLKKDAKVADTADARMKLALWCDGQGLKAEAEDHFRRVVELDPKRDSAWKHLGYKRHGNRWMTGEQIAEEAEQTKANRYWLPILKKYHDNLHDRRPAKREEAKAAFLALTEPRSAPSVWVALAAGGAGEQLLSIDVFRGIKGEASSQSLAVLALSGKSAEVRTAATTALRKRDPLEFAPMLVALIRKPLRYEVKPVTAVGGQGYLIVEGAKVNTRRIYAPPSAPETELKQGDVVLMDENGLPVVHRPGGSSFSAVLVDANGNPYDTFGMQKIRVGENAVEAQRAAASAEAQLENDVAEIEKVNLSIKNSNDRAIAVLKESTGKDLGDDAKAWIGWLAALQGRSAGSIATDSLKPGKSKRVVNSFVNLAYNPQFSIAQPVVSFFGGGGCSHSGST